MGCQPRRRPPACSLCRIRKLRCSRQLPCSNCSIRGVSCHRDGPRGEPKSLHGNVSQEALDRNHLAPSSLASTELQLITTEVLDLQKNCANQKLLVSSSDSWMLDKDSSRLNGDLWLCRIRWRQVPSLSALVLFAPSPSRLILCRIPILLQACLKRLTSSSAYVSLYERMLTSCWRNSSTMSFTFTTSFIRLPCHLLWINFMMPWTKMRMLTWVS